MEIKVFTAFSGYDSQCMALDRLHQHNPDFNYELVGWAEIDKYAIQAHNAVYPQWADRNYGDISKIDWAQVPDFDLFTYSSPCQDFSQAGKQAGGTEGSGTRSSLLWECRRAILAKKPKYLLMENVAALVSQKFIRLFNAWQLELESYGYRNFAKVLNAKDYGVPQNRERIFMVSILDESARYEFPDPMPLTLRLKDVLEDKVDERYYLSEKMIAGFDAHKERHDAAGDGFGWNPTEGDCVAASVTTRNGQRNTDNFILEPVIGAFRGRNPENPSERARSNGRYKQRLEINENGTSNTLTGVQKDNVVIEPIVLGWSRSSSDKGEVIKRHPVQVANCVTSGKRDNTQNYVLAPILSEYNEKTYRKLVEQEAKKHPNRGIYWRDGLAYWVRKLTERECFRLMDVPEAYIDRIQQAGISRSQQYKMAGNSIVVSCMYHIFRKLWIDTQIKTLTLF